MKLVLNKDALISSLVQLRLIVFLILMAYSLGKSSTTSTITFTYHGQLSTSGDYLIEPVTPPRIGVKQTAGRPLSGHDVLACTSMNKELKKVDKDSFSVIELTCEDRKFDVIGIVWGNQ